MNTVKTIVVILILTSFLGCSKEKQSKRMDIDKLEKKVRENQDDRAKFTFEQYEQLLKSMSSEKFIVLPINKFKDSINDSKIVVGMRHDVDRHPFKALEMAELEEKYNMNSTYFILSTAFYYGLYDDGEVFRYECMEDVYKKLAKNGHEIASHNDLLVVMIKKGIDPYDFNKGEINYFNDLGIKVTGTVAHGSGLASATIPNFEIFSDFAKKEYLEYEGESYRIGKYSLKECGFDYESNFVNHTKYFSESGGEWHNIGDFDKLLETIESSEPGDRIQILTHPLWWGK